MKYTVPLFVLLACTACGKSSAPADPLDATARRTCMDMIEARATIPKSVSYAKDDDLPVGRGANGQRDVTIKFSVKNKFGALASMTAHCSVSPDGKTVTNFTATEKR